MKVKLVTTCFDFASCCRSRSNIHNGIKITIHCKTDQIKGILTCKIYRILIYKYGLSLAITGLHPIAIGEEKC